MKNVTKSQKNCSFLLHFFKTLGNKEFGAVSSTRYLASFPTA